MDKKEFYTEQICRSFLPFWEKAVDKNRGGIYTCFNNGGDTLLSTDKYVWSQGRYLWLWARLINLIRRGLLPLNEASFMDDLRKGVSFIKEHAFLPNGNCVFLLDENGGHRISSGVYDSSIYVDCFVCLGFSEYASLTGDQEILNRAVNIYENITRRLEGQYNTMPYPIPKGGRIFGVPMFAMHVGQELSHTMKKWGHPQEEEVLRKACGFFNTLVQDFLTGSYNREMLLPSEQSDTLLASHLTPGHTLECMWFMMHLMRDTGDWSALPRIEAAAKHAFDKGWDTQHGGLLRFIHRDGGPPQGRLLNDPYEELIVKTWDYKLWWPHSEALYFTLLMESHGDAAYWREARGKVEDYSFRTFPNPNKEIGEWVQIRLRDGRPSDQVVALPVKDPYHIMRNFFLIIEELDA